MCTSKTRLDGKTVVITGASSGIGKETARDLYARGARVILACRNMEKTIQAIEDIKNNSPSWVKQDKEYTNYVGELVFYSLDLCSLKSVKNCAKKLLENEAAIHILINNAGMATDTYEKTEDGYEMTLQVNYLSHFLLTLLLLPKMQSSSSVCKIINISSVAHILADMNFDDINLQNSYTLFKSYARTKLGNILFTKELANRLKKANIQGINVYAVHPGLIPTEVLSRVDSILYYLSPWLFKNVEQGAQTTIYCSVDERTINETGLYYSNCSVSTTYRKANDREYAKRLWDMSCSLLQLEPNEDFATLLKNARQTL
ncbi:hypothetical protein PUN28_020183 [Cardiocondyla obscurior]